MIELDETKIAIMEEDGTLPLLLSTGKVRDEFVQVALPSTVQLRPSRPLDRPSLPARSPGSLCFWLSTANTSRSRSGLLRPPPQQTGSRIICELAGAPSNRVMMLSDGVLPLMMGMLKSGNVLVQVECMSALADLAEAVDNRVRANEDFPLALWP